MRNIRQNLLFRFIDNALGITVGAGVLYPVFELLLSSILANLVMTFSSLLVIASSLRVQRATL